MKLGTEVLNKVRYEKITIDFKDTNDDGRPFKISERATCKQDVTFIRKRSTT
jgi:hypothetical protein